LITLFMINKSSLKLSKMELDVLDKLDTPEKIQKFIDEEITYDPKRENRSIQEVIRDKRAECYNGALLALACLLTHNYKASIVELLARDDEEHILCVYRVDGRYGSIAQSKFLGLKSRSPIYKSLHDLVISYMEFYFAFDGRYSLLSHTNLIPLAKYKNKWLHDGKIVVQMAKDLRNSEHFNLIDLKDPFYHVSNERFWKEVLFIPNGVKIPKSYLPRPKKI